VLNPGVKNPLPWLAEQMDITQETNFFEGQVTEYQKASALVLSSDDELVNGACEGVLNNLPLLFPAQTVTLFLPFASLKVPPSPATLHTSEASTISSRPARHS